MCVCVCVRACECVCVRTRACVCMHDMHACMHVHMYWEKRLRPSRGGRQEDVKDQPHRGPLRLAHNQREKRDRAQKHKTSKRFSTKQQKWWSTDTRGCISVDKTHCFSEQLGKGSNHKCADGQQLKED